MKKIFILFILLLSGCSDYKELNNLAIVNTIGIDKKDNNYKLCIEVLNTDKENGKNKIYYSTGKTINEAINKVNNKSPKKVVFPEVILQFFMQFFYAITKNATQLFGNVAFFCLYALSWNFLFNLIFLRETVFLTVFSLKCKLLLAKSVL